MSASEERIVPEGLTLYHYSTCPFCVRVRWASKRLGITLSKKNIHDNPQAAAELQAGGGMGQVPCLRIEEEDGSVRWMYESGDIIDYLQQRFA